MRNNKILNRNPLSYKNIFISVYLKIDKTYQVSGVEADVPYVICEIISLYGHNSLGQGNCSDNKEQVVS